MRIPGLNKVKIVFKRRVSTESKITSRLKSIFQGLKYKTIKIPLVKKGVDKLRPKPIEEPRINSKIMEKEIIDNHRQEIIEPKRIIIREIPQLTPAGAIVQQNSGPEVAEEKKTPPEVIGEPKGIEEIKIPAEETIEVKPPEIIKKPKRKAQIPPKESLPKLMTAINERQAKFIRWLKIKLDKPNYMGKLGVKTEDYRMITGVTAKTTAERDIKELIEWGILKSEKVYGIQGNMYSPGDNFKDMIQMLKKGEITPQKVTERRKSKEK